MQKPLWLLALTLLAMIVLARLQPPEGQITVHPHPMAKVQAGEPVHHIAP